MSVMNNRRIKEFSKKIKAIDDRWSFDIFKDDGYMYKINIGLYRQDRVLIKYDGTTVFSLCMTKNTVPLIPVAKVPMLVLGDNIYIGKDRLDMFADVIKLCGEYLDVLCGSSKQIRGEANGNQTSKRTFHDCGI